MYIFNTERRSFYTIIKNINSYGSGDPVENFNSKFNDIFKLELVRSMSKRKAVVRITKLFSVELPKMVTITFRKNLVMLHNYDTRYRSFDPVNIGTLEEVYSRIDKANLFNFYQNRYLSNRLNNLVNRRIEKIVFKLNTIDLTDLHSEKEIKKLKFPLFKKFYNTGRWIFYKFKPMLNEYYGKHNKYPINYVER